MNELSMIDSAPL